MEIFTLKALEGLKHLDELDGSEDIRVLGGDLDDDLKVLSHVYAEHLLQAGHGLLSRQTAEIGNEPLLNDFHEIRDDDI